MNDSPRAEELLDEIFASELVFDSHGNEFELSAEISRSEGEFLRDLAEKYDARNIIEIGFANGISSLYLCQALLGEGGGHLTIIDPYQSTYWHGVGIANLERANFNSYQLYEEASEYVLPKLIQQSELFDFAFVDGNHNFEFVMTDFLMLNRLLKPGGIIVFDDANFPAISQVIQIALGLKVFGGQHGVYDLAGFLGEQNKPTGSVKRRVRSAIDQSYYSFTNSSIKPLPDAVTLAKPTMIALQRKHIDHTEAEIKTILDTAEVDEKQLGMNTTEICQKFAITNEQLNEWRETYN